MSWLKPYKEMAYDYRTHSPMFYNDWGLRIYVTFILSLWLILAIVATTLELVL